MQHPRIAKAEVVLAAISHNDVVQDLDAEELPGGDQAGGKHAVFLAGLRIAGRVVMGFEHEKRKIPDGFSNTFRH